MITVRDLCVLSSVSMFLFPLCFADWFGFAITFKYLMVCLLLSPLLGVGFVLLVGSIGFWFDSRARARRIARCKARKGEGA